MAGDPLDGPSIFVVGVLWSYIKRIPLSYGFPHALSGCTIACYMVLLDTLTCSRYRSASSDTSHNGTVAPLGDIGC